MTKKKTQEIDASLVEHIVPLVDVAAHLPIIAYEAVENMTVGELVAYAREHDLHAVKARRPGRQAPKGQTEMTADLDSKVLRLVRSIGRKRKDKSVVMRELVAKLQDYSDQQIRRALVRLANAGEIKTAGSTKDKSYAVA